MNLEIGSIMKACYDAFPCTINEDSVEEDFVIPSMFFPPPIIIDGFGSLSSYSKGVQLNVKLFHESSQLAFSKAEEVVNHIRNNRYMVPMISEDGAATGDYLRISRIETSIIEERVCLIKISWKTFCSYNNDRNSREKMQNLFLNKE